MKIDNIIKQSQKAICAIMEREINIPADKVAEVKRKLRNNGFMIIGTSEPNGRFRKVWFIRRGGF